jgi:hypothetical protein
VCWNLNELRKSHVRHEVAEWCATEGQTRERAWTPAEILAFAESAPCIHVMYTGNHFEAWGADTPPTTADAPLAAVRAAQ